MSQTYKPMCRKPFTRSCRTVRFVDDISLCAGTIEPKPGFEPGPPLYESGARTDRAAWATRGDRWCRSRSNRRLKLARGITGCRTTPGSQDPSPHAGTKSVRSSPAYDWSIEVSKSVDMCHLQKILAHGPPLHPFLSAHQLPGVLTNAHPAPTGVVHRNKSHGLFGRRPGLALESVHPVPVVRVLGLHLVGTVNIGSGHVTTCPSAATTRCGGLTPVHVHRDHYPFAVAGSVPSRLQAYW